MTGVDEDDDSSWRQGAEGEDYGGEGRRSSCFGDDVGAVLVEMTHPNGTLFPRSTLLTEGTSLFILAYLIPPADYFGNARNASGASKCNNPHQPTDFTGIFYR